jgi:hypothetical protein
MKTSDKIKITQDRIQRIESDRASNQGRIGEHQRKAKEAADEVMKYGADAANGDGKAREKYDRAKGTETLHREQARQLQANDGELQNKLAEARATRDWLLVKIDIEKLTGEAGDLRVIAPEISDAFAALAVKGAGLKTRLKVIFTNALPHLGERQDLTALDRSVNQSVDHAFRSQLHKSFGAVGINVVDIPRHDEDSDFESVMKKAIDDLTAALEVVMHTASPEHVEGRVRFRVRTQISGLFGMAFHPGQIVSLNPNDPAVLRVAGALERIDDDKAVSA